MTDDQRRGRLLERSGQGAPALAAAHALPVRVYYEDTDAAGIVYHANYLRFAERGRTEWLRELGLDHPKLIAEFGGQFAVRRCSLDFRLPAKLDDALEVITSVAHVGGARVSLRQDVRKGVELLCTVLVELVFVDERLRPTRLPAELRAAVPSASGDRGATAPPEG